MAWLVRSAPVNRPSRKPARKARRALSRRRPARRAQSVAPWRKRQARRSRALDLNLPAAAWLNASTTGPHPSASPTQRPACPRLPSPADNLRHRQHLAQLAARAKARAMWPLLQCRLITRHLQKPRGQRLQRRQPLLQLLHSLQRRPAASSTQAATLQRPRRPAMPARRACLRPLCLRLLLQRRHQRPSLQLLSRHQQQPAPPRSAARSRRHPARTSSSQKRPSLKRR